MFTKAPFGARAGRVRRQRRPIRRGPSGRPGPARGFVKAIEVRFTLRDEREGTMDVDVVIVGGGLAGSGLATVLARQGKGVLVLEREGQFKDRVRGENILPWGVAAARRLGLLDALLAAGGLEVPFFNTYSVGAPADCRPLPQTTPSGECSLNLYHPDMQEALLAAAAKAGARVERGALVRGVELGEGGPRVAFDDGDGAARTARAPLVVGADGRDSRVRAWGDFGLERDRPFLRVAGALVRGVDAPDDATHLCMGPGFATFIAPLGGRRARVYFVYVGATGDRKLSGKGKAAAFLDGCRAAGAPPSWLEGAEVVGPLAEFEGADTWVAAPGKPGLALVGDAAAATDPSWGCGLSKTLVDVELLAGALAETDDVGAAVARYAARHDEAYGKLHAMLSWMTRLVWSNGPEADARRARVLPRQKADPTGFPDPVGQGPFGPCDERARRLILGEA
jgi:2-polyprenyl-6-methoxyphenol hydroxylase-like FAD-dependent oxidoreductase